MIKLIWHVFKHICIYTFLMIKSQFRTFLIFLNIILNNTLHLKLLMLYYVVQHKISVYIIYNFF